MIVSVSVRATRAKDLFAEFSHFGLMQLAFISPRKKEQSLNSFTDFEMPPIRYDSIAI